MQTYSYFNPYQIMSRRTKQKKYSRPASKQDRFCQHEFYEVRLTARSWQITSFVFRCWQGWWGRGEEAIGNGWGCLSYLSVVKISDLVPFTVSQTLVDYQRPSWYLLGCFSLNKIPEISITRTILMIWLEPLEHIDKGVLIFGIF